MKLEGEKLQELLLSYKYGNIIKRLSRGTAHTYNNIFAGLAGQLSLLLRTEERSKPKESRRELIEEMIERGVAQTEALYSLSLDRSQRRKVNNPALLADNAIQVEVSHL